VYGEEYFSNELYLSTVISVSSVFNGAGRMVWGYLSDSIGPIQALIILSGIFSLVLFMYAFVAEQKNEFLFSLWTFLVVFFEGGNFALYLPTTIKLFGSKNASSNYGVIFLSYSLCNFVNIMYLADSNISFSTASTLLGVVCFSGCLSLCWLSTRVIQTFNFNQLCP
jgi:MFS transporter, OFA family, oxalate/formate antiporter